MDMRLLKTALIGCVLWQLFLVLAMTKLSVVISGNIRAAARRCSAVLLAASGVWQTTTILRVVVQ
jgi:hypothetical protein